MKSVKEKRMLCEMIIFLKISTNVNAIICKVNYMWQNIALRRAQKKKIWPFLLEKKPTK